MENYRELTEKQKKFLVEYGVNPNDFLSISTSAKDYKFYHIAKGREVSLRR